MEEAGGPSQKETFAKKALQAICTGNGEELRKLLQCGADPNVAPTSGIKNEASNTLLYHAVAKQDIDLVSILLDQGANVNGLKSEGFPPLRAAVVRNNAALIKMLLTRGADVNYRYTIMTGSRKETKTVLFEVATASTYELLLKSGADVHVKNSWHETPLHFQAYNWSSRLVRALLAYGADVNAVNKKNTTALDNAIFRKLTHRKSDDEEFMEVCRVLLRHKAIISWSDPDQYFLLKAKPDMDSSTIKARLQLVYQWEVQRKAGNTSFKLPIEVFRRGALDIAVYYSALFKGGRIRDSVAFKTDSKDYPEAIVDDSTNKLDQLLHDIENVSDRADSGDDSIFQHSFSQVSDSTCIKVTATTETLNTSGLVSVVETKRDDTGGRKNRGGSYAQSKAAKNIRDDRQSGEVADRENRSVDASKTEAKDIRSKGKVTPQKVTSINSPDISPPPKVIGGGSEQATHLASDHGTVGKTINHNPETSPVRELDSKGSSMSATTEGLSNLEKTHNDEKIESLELDNLLYRCKVCVVGPSRWGKTSFIKSFTSGSSTLEAMDVRTIGIDLFPWSFDVATEGGECQYQVSFWDFAGQEEYRAAHTLFYSSRTLYLLCINLERYYNALSAATDTMNQTVDDSMMEAFVEMHIFRWARMITAHHPQAEFVFLGTKADLVHHDRSKILAIQQDLVMRFKANDRRMKDRVQRALQELKDAKFEIQDSDPITETIELDDQIASCEQILRKRPVLLSEELIIFSSADMKDKGVARGKLKALLMVSRSSVLLPPSYAKLLQYAQQRCIFGQKDQLLFQEKVDMTFLSVTDLIGSACSSKFFRSEDEIIAALHLLHDTGDIVWFEGISEVRLLKERLFLDPLLVIEFVRQIINHKIDAVTAANGYVSHALLQSLPCWREINSTTMQQLKELLLHLHLAYSAGKANRMAWNSDLIVPVYWNRAPDTLSMKTSFPTEEDTTAGLTEYVRWEYAFEPAIPENLFEKLAVATYSPLLRSERIYASSCFIDKISGSSHTCVAKEDSTLNEPMDIMSSVLSVTVVASDRTLAWKQLVWYCMNLENLLKTYPGLLITRSTVSQRNQRYNVDQLLSDQEHFMQLNICTNQEYLPADMEWYTNRSRPGKEIFDNQAAAVEPTNNVSLDTTVALIHEGLYKLNASIENQKESMDYQFQQNAERIDAAVGNLQRFQIALITGMENKAKFPSLWTLEYRGFDDRSSHTVSSSLMASLQRKITTTVVIKFRSELSGICYHEPIVISAAREVFSRFGKCLKVGLTLLSAATPDFCGKDILAIITDECKRQLDRSLDFHEVLHRTGMAQKSTAPHSMEQNPDLSAFEIMMLLSCLLRLHNQDFHAHDIPQLSGLVCGVVVKSGEYVWASRDEIVQHKNDIVLAADHSPLKRANDSLDAEVHGAIVSAPATLHAPGLTETLPPVIPIPPKHGLPSAHSTKANLQEDKIATKGVLQAMRRRLSSSKSSVPIADVQRYILKIIGARGLRIQTSPHPNSGNTPSWSSQLFEVALPVESAHDATITFIVKHGNPVGSTRIAQGSTNFVALTPGESTTEEVCLVKKDKPAGTLQFSLEAFA